MTRIMIELEKDHILPDTLKLNVLRRKPNTGVEIEYESTSIELKLQDVNPDNEHLGLYYSEEDTNGVQYELWINRPLHSIAPYKES